MFMILCPAVLAVYCFYSLYKINLEIEVSHCLTPTQFEDFIKERHNRFLSINKKEHWIDAIIFRKIFKKRFKDICNVKPSF